MIHAVLISAPLRTDAVIFGRPLLERLMLVCQRVGVSRFFVEMGRSERAAVRRSMGAFRDRPSVSLVSSMDDALRQLPAAATCVALSGNLTLSAWHLQSLIARQAARPGEVVAVEAPTTLVAAAWRSALSGDCSTRDRAQSRGTRRRACCPSRSGGARGMRARRSCGWRASFAARARTRTRRWPAGSIGASRGYRLAYTSVTPNQVTVASTALGLVSAWLFAFPGYWPRLTAALLFPIYF
ncbi:MAG TPA: hypothetical protein VMS64_16705 [Candidatus Methylomirabilis sp.]|nr:hypothetical protein [Candidatus Methylomirabilis sp.]